MQRTTWKQIGLSAMAAMLAVGCATGAPQRAPRGAGTTVQGTTTGDLDACAVALGNATTAAGTTGTTGTTGMATGIGGTTGTHTIGANAGAPGTTAVPGTTGTPGVTGAPGDRMEVTANGLVVGNVAIVALPEHDQMPMSPTTGTTGTTGTTAAGGGTTGTAGAPAGSPAGRPVGATGAPAGTTGTTGTTPAGTAANPTALDRIRSACRGVTEIRIVTDSADRATLASITMAMRRGTPVTDYMTDIARIGRKATIAGGPGGAGAGGGGTTPAPAPAPAIRGTTPGPTGPARTGAPATP